MKRLCFFLLCAILVITASCGVAETSDITPQNAEVQQTGPEMGANQETAQVGVFDFENRTVSGSKVSHLLKSQFIAEKCLRTQKSASEEALE